MAKRNLSFSKEFQFMHIIAKATGKGHASDQWIFSREQKAALVEKLQNFLGLFSPIKLLCFTCMSTHLHFMIQVPRDYSVGRKELADNYYKCYGKKILANGHANRKLLKELNNVSCFMQRFLWHFSIMFNHTRNFKRTGHLWQGKFHNTNIGDAESLLKCAVYVLFNPVKASMVDSVFDYKFNSLTYGSDDFKAENLQNLFEAYKYLSGKDQLTLSEFKQLLMLLLQEEMSEWAKMKEGEREQYRQSHHHWDKVNYVDKRLFPD